MSSTRRRIVVLVTILLIAAPCALLLHPRARVALRLVRGFSPLPGDGRVYFEAGAEEQAERVAQALPGAVASVERVHNLPFKSPFRIYYCASHRSFTRRLGLPAGSPVRGMAFPQDVWLSPSIFDFHGRDTHAESIAHELSHLHVDQHLGWLRRVRDLPTWFNEGLADVASGTGFEIVSRAEGLAALASGRSFEPDLEGRFPSPRSAPDYGLSWPMLHAQSRLFVEYLAVSEPSAFAELVPAVLAGEPFGEAFERAFRADVAESWRRFLAHAASEAEARPPT